MHDYKTTVAGLVAAIGASLQHQPGWLGVVGQVLAAGGAGALGVLAADSKK